MKKAVKVGLFVVAVPVVAIVGAFGYGVFLAATGQPLPGEEAGPTEPSAETRDRDASDPAAFLVVPSDLNAARAQDWILSERLVAVEDGEVIEDRAKFASLRSEDAARVHEALRSGGKEFEPMRLHFFALCGELPTEARRAFASLTGAVFRGPGHKLAKSYTGDFSKLLFLQTGDADSAYARAVRAYSAVLEDKEMVGALTHLGVVDQADDWNGWYLHVEEKMATFDALTLLAIRDAIKDEWFGDRSYLREYIGDLAEAKQ